MISQRVKTRGSTATEVLERAWSRLRGLIPGLPPAVIVVMDARSRKRSWGHFAASTWRLYGPECAHEVALSPELFHAPAALLATLVHEAVHASLYVNDPDNPRHVGGVSRDRRGYLYYHRKEFRDAARKLGLQCEYRNGRYGWTLTRWPDNRVPDRYLGVLQLLEQLPWGTGNGGVPWRTAGRPVPVSGQVRMHCVCMPARTILVARSQAAVGGILCAFCSAPFTARQHRRQSRLAAVGQAAKS